MKSKTNKKQILTLIVSLAFFVFFIIILPSRMEEKKTLTPTTETATQVAMTEKNDTATNQMTTESTSSADSQLTEQTVISETKSTNTDAVIDESKEATVAEEKTEKTQPAEEIKEKAPIVINEPIVHEETKTSSEVEFVPGGLFEEDLYKYDSNEAIIAVGNKSNPSDSVVSYRVETDEESTNNSDNIIDALNKVFDASDQNYSGIEFSLSGVAVINSTPAESEILHKQDNGIWSAEADSSIWDSFREIWEIFFPTDRPTLTDRDGISTISQTGVADNIDLEYQITASNGLKEYIIVNLPADYDSSCRLNDPNEIPQSCQSQDVLKNSFVFDLSIDNGINIKKAKNHEFSLASGTYYFVDNNGKYLFHFLKPYAYDANGVFTEQVNLTILDDYGQEAADKNIRNAQIVVTIDRTWMTDINRAFPIVIDPSIINQNSTQFASGLIQDKIEVSNDEIKISNKTHMHNEHLVGVWHFDEESGSTAYDSSGNANNGTAIGTTIVDGMVGKARYYDGYGDYVSIPSDANNTFGTDDFTISFWYKNEYKDGMTVISKYGAYPDPGWTLETSDWGDGTYSMHFMSSASSGGADTSGDYTYNKWRYITVSRTGTMYYFYINGLLVDTDDWISTPADYSSTVPLLVGSDSGGGYEFKGIIDELKIYDAALTADEVGYEFDRYNEGLYVSDVFDLGPNPTYNDISWTKKGIKTGDGETIYDSTDLVAQWNFNETSGTTLTDSSGNGNHGTLSGFADTSGQDKTVKSGWTGDNALFGGGALMYSTYNEWDSPYLDTVTVPHSASFAEIESKDKISMEAWINIHEHQYDWAGATFIEKYGSGGDGWGLIYNEEIDSGLTMWTGDGGDVNCYTELPRDTWTYVAMSYDRSLGYVDFYVDGQLMCNLPYGDDLFGSETGDALVGGMDAYWTGQNGAYALDSMRVYSRTLTADEVVSNFQAGNAIIETRTGPDSDPNSGNWEDWEVVGTNSKTVLDNFDSSAGSWNWDAEAGDITKNKINDSILKSESTGAFGVTIDTPPTTTNSNRLDLYRSITSTDLSGYSYLTLNSASDTADRHTQLIIGESAYVNNETDANTVGLWRLDETAGTGAYIKDYSGVGNDGTPTGTSAETGKFGLCRVLDGTGEHIDVGDSVNPGNQFTVEAWMKGALDPSGASPGKASNWVVDGTKVYFIYTSGGVYTGSMNTDGTGYTSTLRVSSSSSYLNTSPTIDIDPSGKVYYGWIRAYTPTNPDRYYIATAESAKDGTGWTYTQRTISGAYLSKYSLNISVGSSKVFYAWIEDGDVYQGELIISSSSWSDAPKTADSESRSYLNMQVANGNVYYAWISANNVYTNVTAEGTPGWSPVQQTNTSDARTGLKMHVTSTGADYYAYQVPDINGDKQLWTANSSWTPVQQTFGDEAEYPISFENIIEHNGKIYYTTINTYYDPYFPGYVYRADPDGTNWEKWVRNIGKAKKIYMSGGNVTIWSDSSSNLYAGDLFGTRVIFEGDSYGITMFNEYIGGYVNGTTHGPAFVFTDKQVTDSSPTDDQGSKWKYIVMTADGTNLSMYVNGTLIDRKPFSENVVTSTDNFIIGNTIATGIFTDYPEDYAIDEVRVSDVARTAEEILQAFNINKRTYNLNYNFKADLVAGNLIDDLADPDFTIDATNYGLTEAGSNIYVGEKIIVTEGSDKAQGTVASVNPASGAVTVYAWDSGSTFPGGGYTVAAEVFKWQEHIIDLGMIPDSHIDSTTRLTLVGNNYSSTRNIWLDELAAFTQPTGSTISSTEQQFFQYKVQMANSALGVTPSVSGFELDYSPSGSDPISLDSATTSETELNNDNIETFNIQAVGVDVAATGETVTCQASWDNQTTWNDFATAISPLASATVQNEVVLTNWDNIPDNGTVTFYVRCFYDVYSSNVVSFNINKDTSPPEPGVVSIVSVAGDTSAPYYDMTDDGTTAVEYTTTLNTLDALSSTVALYNMNETAEDSCSGGEDLCDASGNDNHGINNGATIGDGKTGNGWVFDGTADYIEVADDDTLDLGTGDFTIEYWLNMTSSSTGQDYFTLTKTSDWDTTPGWGMNNHGYYTWSTGNRFDINFFITNGDSYSVWSRDDKYPNNWYHVAVVRDGSDLRMYINAELEFIGTSGNPNLISSDLDNSEPLLIGKSSFDVNNFPGIIDELRISKEARSAYMIEQDYLNGAHVTDCKWDETDTDYASMGNTCTDTANCDLTLTTEETKTVYMRCEDSNATVSSTSYQLDYTIGSPPPPPDPGITAQLSNTMPSESTNLTVTYDTDISSVATVTDGSLKVILSDEFDLASVTDSDISVTGGDVTWSSDFIIKNDDVLIGRNSSWLYEYFTDIARAAGETSIVFPFTGDFDAYDNTTEMIIGNLNQIINPLTPGTYDVLVQVYDGQDGTGNLITESLAKVVILDGVTVTASVPSTLSFTITGLSSGASINGSTTDTASTSIAIDFGVFTSSDNRISAHDLSVSSNATDGFVVTQQVTGNLASFSDSIGNFTGSNASPISWVTPPGSGTESYWGYTTEDTTLSQATIDRFDGGLWAGFSTSPYEIFHHDGPTDSTGAGQGITRVGYQIEITDLQEAGIYTTNVMYVCTPTY